MSTFFFSDLQSWVSFEVAKGEMHILAYCYHWGRNELWDLPPKERKMWVEMVLEQKRQENKELEKEDKSVSSYAESY